MLKTIFLVLIFSKFCLMLKDLKRCDFRDCNYEGECQYNDENEKVCKCIGQRYFKGSKCNQNIDICQTENPCKNNAKCYPLVGQFICQDCKAGLGGLRCDLEVSNAIKHLVLYFNHYGFYGKAHKFIIMLENLGEIDFSLEFVSDRYVIDSFETEPQQQTEWFYSENLQKIIQNSGIRYYQDLPYSKGFYHVSTQTFWEIGQLELHLSSFDTETGTKLFYQQQFKLLIANVEDKCVPTLNFIYGSKPSEPLTVDIAVYNNFEIHLQSNCFKKSDIKYKWMIFNSIGSVKLYDFGTTNGTVLKVRPYKLWFNYHGAIVSSYRVVVRMTEQYSGKSIVTEARCFIFVLPKPILAVIKGGEYREIGVKQELILDATASRDYALAPAVNQEMIYRWSCISIEDSKNKYCKEFMPSTSVLKIPAGQLKFPATYNYTLSINSKVNKFVFDEALQIVKVTEDLQILIDIQCLRNCERHQFVKDELLHLKVVSQGNPLTNAATYEWFLNDQIIGRNQHLVYKPENLVSEVEIKVLVEDVAVDVLQGKCLLKLNENLVPAEGSCSIEPLRGEAFKTDFHIKCENYQDEDIPLNYEYFARDGFPLQRTNVEEISISLPPTSEVNIKICDQFKACVEEKLKVDVKDLEKPQDLKMFLRNNTEGLQNLLFKGDILKAMVLLKSLALHIDEIEYVSLLVKEMAAFNLLTLMQVQQFLDITLTLYKNNLPMEGHKLEIFNNLLLKLHVGFMASIQDNEIESFTRSEYEKSTKDFMQIMSLLSQTWQHIPAIQDDRVSAFPSTQDPLKETYEVLADFDIDIAFQLEHWLKSSELLENILKNFALSASVLYKPLEHSLELEEDDYKLKILAFNTDTQQEMSLKNNVVSVTLSKDLIKELKQKFYTNEFTIQMAAFENNPFWWYPSKVAISTPILTFLCLGVSRSFKPVHNLKNPFAFEIQLNNINSSSEHLEGIIKNITHMPLYSLLVEANAVLVVNFLKTQKPLKILVKFERIPYSFEIFKTGFEVKMSLEKQIFIFNNPFNRKAKAYLAILLSQTAENVSFTFSSELRECLYWDFMLKDPQWSSEGCTPQLELTANQSLSCLCHHFSTFSVRTYMAYMQKDVKEHNLLQELPINWSQLMFYLCFSLIFFVALIINLFYYKNHNVNLPLKGTVDPQSTMEICIFTGSHFNATTTANISLRMVSSKGPFALTITQDPLKPVLKRNSLCRIRLSNKDITLPLKLSLTNDRSGRYPSWFCHKIKVIDIKNQQQQIFLINRWLDQQTLEIFSSNSNETKFLKHFLENLSVIYLNWFQFQAFWGCWQYKDWNRLERSCLLLSQLMVSICLVACYFGPTTMQTYEQERILYYNLSFNIKELILLSIICYVISFIIKLLFLSLLWIIMTRVMVIEKGAANKLL